MPQQVLHPVSWTKAKGFHFSEKGLYVRRYEAENLRQELLGMEAAYQTLQQEYHRLKSALSGLAEELRRLDD